MVDPLSYFSVLHKGGGMCYPVCGMVHINIPFCQLKTVAHVVVAAGFLFHYLSVHLPDESLIVTVPTVLYSNC